MDELEYFRNEASEKERKVITKLIRVTILVRDQDEALRWYPEKLGFEKKADKIFGQGFRWLTIAPKNQREVEIVLQKPDASCKEEILQRSFLNAVVKEQRGSLKQRIAETLTRNSRIGV